ncbi:MAG UNVERIFIED_CONTAM: hypothetical protein LVR29_28465 [Microcystis novacekii LVE1205-3]|jgi:hypothetical protein
MDKTSLIDKVKQMANKRDYLLQLCNQPDIGGLRLDVNQALEELDELLDEFQATFPEEKLS